MVAQVLVPTSKNTCPMPAMTRETSTTHTFTNAMPHTKEVKRINSPISRIHLIPNLGSKYPITRENRVYPREDINTNKPW